MKDKRADRDLSSKTAVRGYLKKLGTQLLGDCAGIILVAENTCNPTSLSTDNPDFDTQWVRFFASNDFLHR